MDRPHPVCGGRTGWIADYFFFGQWFPKIGVLEDAGWNTHQFHAATEFYADFGVYDVQMTVPGGYKVGATGREMRRVDNADGTTTHSYHADDVADFGWTTSPSFIEERRAFNHPRLPSVEMRLLLRPEHRGQETRQFAAAAAALEHYGQWFGPYPYGNITIVDPAYQSDSDGMEYPMLFTGRANWLSPPRCRLRPTRRSFTRPATSGGTRVVATNEFEHGWMDEGITTWATARVIEEARRPNMLAVRTFGSFIPYTLDVPLSREVSGNRMPTYRPGRGVRRPDHADVPLLAALGQRHHLRQDGAVDAHARAAPGLADDAEGDGRLLRPLEIPASAAAGLLPGRQRGLGAGPDVVLRSGRPRLEHLRLRRAGVEAGAVEPGPLRAPIVVAQRLGEATFPVDVVTTFADGQQATEHWDGKDRRAVYTYDRPPACTRVEIDPGHVLLLDVNRTNNSRTTQPRGAEAARKWSLAWMVWLQELMITSGIFG